MKHLYEAPLAPRALRPDLPELAEKAIMRALAKKPADRFASAGELAQAFEASVTDQPALPLLFPPLLAQEHSQAAVTPGRETGQPVPVLHPQEPLSTRLVPIATNRSKRGQRVLLAGLVTTAMLLLALFSGLLPGGPAVTLPASPGLLPPLSRWQQLARNGTTQLHSVPFGDGSVTITAKNNTVYAVRDSNGSLLWKRAVNGQVVPPPVVAGRAVFIVTTTGTVYASQGSNGHPLWSYNTGHPVNKPLVVANGVVSVQTSNGFVHELRASDGQLLDIVALTPGTTPTTPSGGTPVPGTTPAGGVTPTPATGVTPTPTSGVTPTPTSGITPTPTSGTTPTPTPGITPTPTTGAAPSPTPVVAPTSGVTPTPASSTPGASPEPTGTPGGD